MPDVIAQFRDALAARGITPDHIEADGRLHRCPVEGGKSGRKDGSYVLHLDNLPSGGFDNWRDGMGWQSWSANLALGVSHLDRCAWAKRKLEIMEQRREEEAARYAEAAKRAAQLLSKCHPATNQHPYLMRKGVNAYGLKLLREQLVIPLRDVTGQLTSLQFIMPDGQKRFLTGGRKRGCYFAIGVPRDHLVIAEGYATAASVFEAKGWATACAFDAGNLKPVAMALRAKFPDIYLIIAADNDSETAGNPGVTCAIDAARSARARVATPQFWGVGA